MKNQISRKSHPYFSIITPTYNRCEIIGKAIESCLSQDFSDFELIIVDDGSTDCTADYVQRYGDNRIKLITHETNLGVCPARNTGIAHSHGQWLLMVDSDFELLPGALRFIAQRTAIASHDVGNVASSCQWDTGIITPLPDVPPEPVGYEQFLSWLDRLVVSEWFNCLRREVFLSTLYPSGRSYESSFHLNVALHWKIDVSREPAIIYHTDAQNRITKTLPSSYMSRLLRDAHDCAIDAEYILQKHGQALRKWAPHHYRNILNRTAMYCFLTGWRLKGIQYSLSAIRSSPYTLNSWIILLLGILGAKPLAWAKAHHQ